jgi:hypothetical protein
MNSILCNDKFLVTLTVLILGIGAFIWGYLTSQSPENIITAIVSGLFGMAAGRSMQRTEDKPTRTESGAEPKV